MKLTQKDIRDIASYWGVRCIYGYSVYDLVDSSTLSGLEVGERSSLKLHLRPIASLTDEELLYLYNLINDLHGVSLTWNKMKQALYDKDLSIIEAPAVIVSYLQSIGVYVPGTIRLELVELL